MRAKINICIKRGILTQTQRSKSKQKVVKLIEPKLQTLLYSIWQRLQFKPPCRNSPNPNPKAQRIRTQML